MQRFPLIARQSPFGDEISSRLACRKSDGDSEEEPAGLATGTTIQGKTKSRETPMKCSSLPSRKTGQCANYKS